MSTNDPTYWGRDTRTRAERRVDLRVELLRRQYEPTTAPGYYNPGESHSEVMRGLTRIHPAAIDDRNARKRERRVRRV